MPDTSKKSIYEARDELIKTENYTEDSRRYPPRDRMNVNIRSEERWSERFLGRYKPD